MRERDTKCLIRASISPFNNSTYGKTITSKNVVKAWRSTELTLNLDNYSRIIESEFFHYKKRSKRVTSHDFDFLYNFCTVVSYFYRSSVDSRFLLLTNKLCNFRDFFMYETNFGSLKFPK